MILFASETGISFGEWVALLGVVMAPACIVSGALIKMFADMATVKSDVRHVRDSCDELCDRIERIESHYFKR